MLRARPFFDREANAWHARRAGFDAFPACATMADLQRKANLAGLIHRIEAIFGRAKRYLNPIESVEFKVFQYWDVDLPDDIRSWTETVKARSDQIGYRLLDKTAARDFIHHSHGRRYVRAFDSCALPAMQADLLRLCLMHAVGGLWIDAGYECALPLGSFLHQTGETFVPAVRGLFYNGVLMFRKPGNAFIGQCLELAIDNIENRRCTKVVVATGPGVFNAIRWVLDRRWRRSLKIHARVLGWDKWGWQGLVSRATHIVRPTPALLTAYEGLTSFSPTQLDPWLTPRFGEYKSKPTYWHRWDQNIYT